MNILIGISGKPRSGKDAVGAFLEEKYGFHRYAFGDYLKYLLNKYFDVSKEELWGAKTKQSRFLLQNLGKLLNEEIDERIFVDVVSSSIKSDYLDNKEDIFCAVVTDVRRDQEANIFRRESNEFVISNKILPSGIELSNIFDKSVLIKIERPIQDIVPMEDGLEENIKHEIESFPDTNKTWDYFLKNDSDLNSLLASVERMLHDIMK